MDRLDSVVGGVADEQHHDPAAQDGRLQTGSTSLVRASVLPAAVGFLYLGLVLLLWLPLGYKQGMGYETKFPYNSETMAFLRAFIYRDPLRPYTSVFYNLGYHLSAWLGIGGSFLGFQLVYAALWWARGLLAYLIVAMLFPRRKLIALLVGGLVLIHASDHALNWVGQLNQFGMIFWMLCAFYALVIALDAKGTRAAVVATLAAMFFVQMCLWSYESALFIIVAFPIIVLATRYGFSRRTLRIVAAFYVFPLVYVFETIWKYATTGSAYQESVLRSSFPPLQLLSDLWFNVVSSLDFTRWGDGLPVSPDNSERIALAIGGGVVFALGIAAFARMLPDRGERGVIPARRLLWILLGVGFVLLLLSFPAYLILASARDLWRTQFLSGVGAALIFVAAIALLASLFRRRDSQVAVIAVLGGVIAAFGVSASFKMASYHYGVWQRHRTAVAEVLAVAPRVKAGTLVVLTGVPRSADPFGDDMWFDLALRLAYPREPVAGIYLYADGLSAPHESMVLRGRSWEFQDTGTGVSALLQHVPFAATVIVRYSPSSGGTLVTSLPAKLGTSTAAVRGTYDPAGRIETGPPARVAERRYGPIASR